MPEMNDGRQQKARARERETHAPATERPASLVIDIGIDIDNLAKRIVSEKYRYLQRMITSTGVIRSIPSNSGNH